MDLSPLLEAQEGLGLSLSAEQLERLQAFGRALYDWNERVNLTRVPPEGCAVRHFLDSLLVSPLVPSGASVLDAGTGPGFPAWPLACARPDLTVTAVDGSEKPLAFLRSQPLPNLKVVQTRLEEWGEREGFDVVTGRAVAPLAAQLELSAAFARIGGSLIPFRTPADEATARSFPASRLGLLLESLHSASLPEGAGERLFPVYRKTDHTDRRFPRRWAEIKTRPLA